jgi:FtsH-binding integral membrane protein
VSESLAYQGFGAASRDDTHTLFGQTMGYVAITAALFALGAYLGRNLSGRAGLIWFIAAFVCLIAMRFTARRSPGATIALLAAFGLLIGLAFAQTLNYYATMNTHALWQAGGATALFIAGFGAAGYATKRDLSGVARICFLGAAGAHRVRHCADLRSHPGRIGDLLAARPGDLRGLHDV